MQCLNFKIQSVYLDNQIKTMSNLSIGLGEFGDSDIAKAFDNDLEKAVPIGTVNKHGKIKTAEGWVYQKKGKGGGVKAKAPKEEPKKKEMSFREVLDDRSEGGGRAIMDSIDEYRADLSDQPGRKEHMEGLGSKVAELEEKTGYKVDISDEKEAYEKANKVDESLSPVHQSVQGWAGDFTPRQIDTVIEALTYDAGLESKDFKIGNATSPEQEAALVDLKAASLKREIQDGNWHKDLNGAQVEEIIQGLVRTASNGIRIDMVTRGADKRNSLKKGLDDTFNTLIKA